MEKRIQNGLKSRFLSVNERKVQLSQKNHNLYTSEEVKKIISGYKMLDEGGRLSTVLKEVSICKACSSYLPTRSDHPVNVLVRPLPLNRLCTNDDIQRFKIHIKRDDTYLRELFNKHFSYEHVLSRMGSAKFSIGLLPWLDRCMLYRTIETTKLMIIGIDYKHFPVFYKADRKSVV